MSFSSAFKLPQLVLIVLFLQCSIDGFSQVEEGTLLDRWFDTTLAGSAQYNNTYNEIWGIAQGDKEYAIIGSTFGTHFIDVTDPSAIQEIIRIEGAVSTPQIVHRDYHDLNGYLYAVADEGANSTLQIMDLSGLPDTVTVVYDSKEYIRRTHNIFIDESTEIMYACVTGGDDVAYAALRLFDISDPLLPVPIATYNSIQGVFISQVHDAHVKDGLAYLNNGPSGLMVVDFTDPLSPIIVSSLAPSEYPDAGYNHSGWPTENGEYYYFADENHDADIKTLDMRDLMNPMVVSTFDAGNDNQFSIPHNQIVHDGYLYVSYYYDGLQVYDLVDPANPERVMHYPTCEIDNRNTYEGSWGIYPFLPSGIILVSDMQEGLFVVDAVKESTSTNNINNLVDVIVYPNPVSNELQVVTNIDANKVIQLSNAVGTIVKTIRTENNTTKINVRSLPVGNYILQVRAGDKQSTQPVVIVR